MTPESAPDGDSGHTPHYFEGSPSSPSRQRTVRLRIPDGDFELLTDSGVFAADRIDRGTAGLLVETSPVVNGPLEVPPGDLVDLGAGYGPITVALAHRYPARRIWAVEPNSRARELCRTNIAANCPDAAVNVVAPDEIPQRLAVAAVFSNPPIRIGKAALHSLLLEWLNRLDRLGSAWLVVQRHLGSDSLANWLTTQGYEVQRLASRKGYRILQVRHSTPEA